MDILEGSWKGEGRGQFPGVTSFNFRETLTFTCRDEKTMAYEQRTQKLYDGQTEYLPPTGRMASSASWTMATCNW